MLDFRNWTFSSPNLCMRAIVPRHCNFHHNWKNGVTAKKMIFNMASVRHLQFANFWIFVTFLSSGSKFASANQISSNSDDSRLRYGDNYKDFQNGGRPPCWIYCDVIVLYRKTEFNALDIVLNFDVPQFHTFWYTSSVIFHRFSLKLPIFALIFTFFFQKYGKY